MDEGKLRSNLKNGLLLAYVDGTLDDETRRRIQELLLHDPELASEARRLVQAESALERRLGTPQSPSHQELGEYILGLLPKKQTARLERRLAADPELRRKLDETRRYLAARDLPGTAEAGEFGQIIERVKFMVARLTGGLPALGGLSPAPAGLRGGEGAPYTFEIDGGQVILEVARDDPDPSLRSLVGVVLGVESPEALTAQLHAPGQPAVTAPVDELGNFLLRGILLGTYDLTIESSTIEILVPAVEVK